MLLLHYADSGNPSKPAASGRFTPLDTEARDGQGRTALWHAADGARTALVAALVEEGGARVFYQDGDLSCPLQLACRSINRHGKKVRWEFDEKLISTLCRTVFYTLNF